MSSDYNTTVTVIGSRGGPRGGQSAKSSSAVNAARRRGENIDTQSKWGAGQNKNHRIDKNTAVLDAETEELKHSKVDLSIGKLIQQGRQAKEMTQKDLATKICEKPQVVTDYECGKAVPNQQILAKMERALGIKLRGKDKGQPLQPKGGAKKAGGK